MAEGPRAWRRRLPALATGLLASLATQSAAAPPRSDRCATTIREHGGKGDGREDDISAIEAALATGCAVDGENLSYRLTRTLMLPDQTALRHATFKNALATGPTSYLVQAQNVRDVALSNVTLDRGGDPLAGQSPQEKPYERHSRTAAFLANSVEGLRLEDVEVFGDGVGTGLKIVDSVNIDVVRPKIHDMRWESYQPPDNEVLVGIWFIRSRDIRVEKPLVYNLLPAAIVYPPGHPRAGLRNNMTDGIDSSGSSSFVVSGAEVYNVGEAFDYSGSQASVDYVIDRAYAHDIDSYCFKSTHTTNGVVSNSVAERCGLAGFVYCQRIDRVALTNNKAKDIGSNRAWSAYGTSGYWFNIDGAEAPGNVVLRDNSAQDSQTRRTMKYGFRNDQTRPMCDERDVSVGQLKQDFIGFTTNCEHP